MRVLGVSTTSHPPHGAVMTTNEAALHKALLALYRVTDLNDETQAA